MKNFLKKNLWLIIGFTISIVLMFLGSLSIICILLGSFITGVLLLVVSYKFRNRYKEMLISQEEADPVFDATIYDYDEDIYYLDTGKTSYKTKIKEGLTAKISAQAPCILFAIFGVGLIFLSITLVIRLFI